MLHSKDNTFTFSNEEYEKVLKYCKIKFYKNSVYWKYVSIFSYEDLADSYLEEMLYLHKKGKKLRKVKYFLCDLLRKAYVIHKNLGTQVPFYENVQPGVSISSEVSFDEQYENPDHWDGVGIPNVAPTSCLEHTRYLQYSDASDTPEDMAKDLAIALLLEHMRELAWVFMDPDKFRLRGLTEDEVFIESAKSA